MRLHLDLLFEEWNRLALWSPRPEIANVYLSISESDKKLREIQTHTYGTGMIISSASDGR